MSSLQEQPKLIGLRDGIVPGRSHLDIVEVIGGIWKDVRLKLLRAKKIPHPAGRCVRSVESAGAYPA